MREASALLPQDHENALLVGRVFDPQDGGPSVVAIRHGKVLDLTQHCATVSQLLEADDIAAALLEVRPSSKWTLEELLHRTTHNDVGAARFLAPCDLQVIKACGVTFVGSMLERVIEEKAAGDPARAAHVRAQIAQAVGTAISSIKPGSAQAAEVKAYLVKEGLWSQYLEVGIGPDAEVFTKAPVLSAVGPGEAVGILESSHWNNPEPELVLAVDSRGRIRGVTLGNDVNLRDIEGRSALLLGKAKDNNASCAIGPFIRIFDDGFSLDDARSLEISLKVSGKDGFELNGNSSIKKISRDLSELVTHASGRHHQYPDGFMLFTGTLFAPTEDRDVPGEGFTHKPGDVVCISSPQLGSLTNTVTLSEEAAPWQFGITALMRNLAKRGLL